MPNTPDPLASPPPPKSIAEPTKTRTFELGPHQVSVDDVSQPDMKRVAPTTGAPPFGGTPREKK